MTSNETGSIPLLNCWFQYCSHNTIHDESQFWKHLREQHSVTIKLGKPNLSYDIRTQCRLCDRLSTSNQHHLDHYYQTHGMKISSPRLGSRYATDTLKQQWVEGLKLAVFLKDIPYNTWLVDHEIVKLGRTVTFESWHQKLIQALSEVSDSSLIPRHIKTFAKKVRDVHILQKSSLEERWESCNSRTTDDSDKEDESPFTTPTGSHTIMLGQNRKYHENYATPESTNRYLLDLKARLKMEEINTVQEITGTAKLKASRSVMQIPRAVWKLLDDDVGYVRKPVVYENEILLDINSSVAEQIIESTVSRYGTKFVNAILLNSSNWVLVTHLDIFYQRDVAVDDCALPPNTASDTVATIHVLQKTEGRYGFKELIIQCGPLQLLVVGGYYGQLGSSSRAAFLGSALPKKCDLNTNDSFTIMTPFFSVKCTRGIRHLRNYTKQHAGRLWSFGSEQFNTTGFSPCHPLFYDNHPARINSKTNTASVASLIIRHLATRSFSKQDYARLKSVMAKIPNVIAAIDSHNTIPETFLQLRECFPPEEHEQSLVKLIDFCILLEKELGDKDCKELTFLPSNISNFALDLCKSVLAPAVHAVNDKILKSLEKR